MLEHLSGNLFEGSPIKVIWGDRGIALHGSAEITVCRFSELGVVAEITKGVPGEEIDFLPSGSTQS